MECERWLEKGPKNKRLLACRIKDKKVPFRISLEYQKFPHHWRQPDPLPAHTHVINLRILLGSHTAQLKSCSLVCRSSRMSPGLDWASVKCPTESHLPKIHNHSRLCDDTYGRMRNNKPSWCQIHKPFQTRFPAHWPNRAVCFRIRIPSSSHNCRTPWLKESLTSQKRICFPVVFPTASYRFSKAPGIKRQIARIQAFVAREESLHLRHVSFFFHWMMRFPKPSLWFQGEGRIVGKINWLSWNHFAPF